MLPIKGESETQSKNGIDTVVAPTVVMIKLCEHERTKNQYAA